MNSNQKGKRGEREFAAVMRAAGFNARRGQQFCGSPDSPDVVSSDLNWLHVEVKREQRLNINAATRQAESDSGDKPFIIAHRRNRSSWLITARATFILAMLHELTRRGGVKRLISSSRKKGENA
jgi:Holliday junction resolvase